MAPTQFRCELPPLALVAHSVQGSAARGTRVGAATRVGRRPTVAAVVEAGRIWEDGTGDELPGEDGSGGREIAEIGEEHHHLRSTE